MSWNFSEAVHQIAQGDLAERTALIHDDQIISFAELNRRATGFGAYLISRGILHGAHVGHYMRNSNAYLETFIAAGMAGMSHVNVNYRYLDEELRDLCNSLDIQVLVYDTEFAETVARIRKELTGTAVYIEVCDGDPANDFAVALPTIYETDTRGFERHTAEDDLLIITTGGTTGLPKGTQWRQEDMWRKIGVCRGGALHGLGIKGHPDSMDEHIANIAKLPPAPPVLPLAPLMHGSGLLLAILALAQGSPVITISGKRFDADRALDTIARHKVGSIVIVGDAFGIPMLEALDRRREEDLLGSLNMLINGGTILNDDKKKAFTRHKPNLTIVDSLASSEAGAIAVATAEAGVFKPLPKTRVFDDEMREVVPGSDTVGIAYSGGYLPIGYYNDPAKTAETFFEIEGKRYVKVGDRCKVRKDGMLVLLGRDSTVINTGGEKVFTEEVARVLLKYPTVADALVVGLPHPRFGKMVVAVVEGPELDANTIDEPAIQDFAREHLADYKVPKRIIAAPSLQRTANGKPDYAFVTRFAEQHLTAEGS